MRINKKLVGAALIVAAIAFTGAASTASNTVAAGAGRLGYSDTTVTGGTINSTNQTADKASYTPTTGLTDPAGNTMLANRFDSVTNSNF